MIIILFLSAIYIVLSMLVSGYYDGNPLDDDEYQDGRSSDDSF
jgi:hypothetical protein